jgi:hypothetical protein
VIVTPGQRADCTQFIAVLEKIRGPRSGPGRPRVRPDSLAADKAYSNGPVREHLRRRSIPHTIPEKTDSQAARLRKGSRGGRPPGFDADRYKKRNTVKRAINHLKQSRAVATHVPSAETRRALRKLGKALGGSKQQDGKKRGERKQEERPVEDGRQESWRLLYPAAVQTFRGPSAIMRMGL